MLEKAARTAATRWSHNNGIGRGIILPFLYATPTIQLRTYNEAHTESTVARKNGRRSAAQGRPSSPGRRDTTGRINRRRHEVKALNDAELGSGRISEPSPEETTALTPPRRDIERVDAVPFENAADGVRAGDEDPNSTITPREKKAFEKLFSLQKAKVTPTPTTEKGKKDDRRRDRPRPKFPPTLQPLAQEAQENQQGSTEQSTRQSQTPRDDATNRLQFVVNEVLDKSRTDVELWQNLKAYVLNRTAALKLDPEPSPYAVTAAKQWTELAKTLPSQYKISEEWESSAMTTNLPIHLLHYMSLCRERVPTSPAPLNVLPALKELGPSAFAMGASTALYNAHMRLLHRFHPFAIHLVVDVLEEMDREVYPFDDETVDVIANVMKETNKCIHGERGRGVQAIFVSARVRKGLGDLKHWMQVGRERREEEVLQETRKRTARAEDPQII
jgi:hypothetical protein